MNWISKIAWYRNIRSEIPNQELARELAEAENADGIKEISEYLNDKNSSISSDCIKVLYEIGYLKPKLIQDYVNTFLNLLESKNNRMVWGGMIALATIAQLRSEEIYKQIDLVLLTIKKGTLITEVWGIKTLVDVSMNCDLYKERLLPVLFEFLEKCRPIDFATRVETLLPVIVTPEENEIFNRIIEIKSEELSEAQRKKLQTIMKRYSKQKRE
jgi:hypothetical protein